MSRAIPSSFSQYLLDQSSINTGIICDGGIMPLRNNLNSTSTWYRNCLRGEDIMFLKEACAARLNSATNYGLENTQIRADRLTSIRTLLGNMIQSGLWTDNDPCTVIGWHSLGTSYPQRADIQDYIQSKLHPISQHSTGDTYTTLRKSAVLNLFKDAQELNYNIPFPQATYDYGGFTKTTQNTLHRTTTTGHTDGTSTTTQEDVPQTNSWLWYSSDSESYSLGRGYPDGLRNQQVQTTGLPTMTFTESTISSWRRWHRYMAVRMFGVFYVFNSYTATWSNTSSDSGNDSHESGEYILAPLPRTAFVDLLTATTISYPNWDDWIDSMYSYAGMQRLSSSIIGEYDTSAQQHSRSRTSYINAPLWTFPVCHFLYCNLEGVTIV